MNAQRRKERGSAAARHEPAPVSEAEPPPEPVEPKPRRRRRAGHVTPANPIRTLCRRRTVLGGAVPLRARGLDEPYDDDPPEQDELDELIYGSN